METSPTSQFYRQHVEEALLSFWLRAVDHQNGGVFTCFSNSGDRLLSKDKYTWSQGRYLWLWSKIAEMISSQSLGGDADMFICQAGKTASFLEENVFLENGNCAFLLSETGEKKEILPGDGFDISIFADCFVVLGLAKYSGLMKDPGRFSKTLKLYNSISERIQSGKFRSEPYPVPDGYRPHSIPMIMLNVSGEMARTAEILKHPETESLHHKSTRYMDDIMMNFYQSDHRVSEMLPLNSSNKNSLLYRHINPGHAIESMWFVMETAEKNGNSDYIHKAALAIEKALNAGWDQKYGGLLRFADENGGKPVGEKGTSSYEKMISDTWDMKLWWPHSEALYATLLGYTLTGNESLIQWHQRIQEYVFEIFPNPDRAIGEWIQIRDRKGSPLDKMAALPVKDPFHILRNLILIIDILEKEENIKKRQIIWHIQ